MVECLFNCKQPTTVASFIAAGQGISALTELTMQQIASPLLTWRPLIDPVVSRSIGIVRHNGRSLSPAAQMFVRELERQARMLRMEKVRDPADAVTALSA
jgi:DNA-binding transcriptional LysR family regulator